MRDFKIRSGQACSLRFRLAVLSIFLLGTMCQAGTKLVLFGGGEPPEAGLKRFSAWAGGKNSVVLVISWASGNHPSPSFLSHFMPNFEGTTIQAPAKDVIASQKQIFLEDILPRATGVFFTGGDQTRIMEVLQDPDLFRALTKAYQAGIVFGGTSAGTAIMSAMMFTGEEDLTKINPDQVMGKGLGLFTDVVLDQHFIKRQRYNRLFSVMFKSREPLGIGIDEKAAIAVENNERLEVMGEDLVMLVDNAQIKGKFVVEFLKAGDKYSLATRSKVE